MSKKNLFKEAAKAAGEILFFDGVPCKRGHIANRYVRNSACAECAKLDGIGRKPNDKIRANARKYYQRDKEKIAAKGKIYRENNKEKLAAKQKEWRDKNPDRIRDRVNKWQRANPDRVNAYAARRRAASRKAEGKYTIKDVDSLFENQCGKCANCHAKLKKSGKNKFHVDHIMPLAKGGSNWPSNLQLLCPYCNIKKSAKDPIAWANENGKLL